MLLIPIAQEENTVRRTPWVSFALIGLCFAVFLLGEAAGDAESEWEHRFGAFIDYLGDHPYLSPPPEIRGLMSEGFDEALEEARSEWENAGGRVDPATAGTQQAELNDLAQAAVEALHSIPAFRFGFVPASPRVLSAFTSMFMHSGWFHLLGNMLFLFLTGPFIEDRYGRPLFAGFYFLSGLAALGGHVAHQPGSAVPLVGASGAIAGVMGAFLVRLGAARIRFLFIPIPLLWMFRTQLVLPAFVVLPLWMLEQLWYANIAPEAGVAWWAHIGGFTFGLLFALGLKMFSVEENWIHPAIEKQVGIDQNPALERAMDARLAGDVATARRELRGVLQAEPDNLDAWRESYETALAAADPSEVARTGERLLALAQKLRDADLSAEIAQDPRWRELAALPTRFHLAVGGYFEKEGDGRSALEQYEVVVARSPRDPAALRALLRRAEILKRGGDRKGAREALLQAKAHPACSDAWPALIEKGLRELAG
jgi:membrane associated rhomboid family serine protease